MTQNHNVTALSNVKESVILIRFSFSFIPMCLLSFDSKMETKDGLKWDDINTKSAYYCDEIIAQWQLKSYFDTLCARIECRWHLPERWDELNLSQNPIKKEDFSISII